MKPETKVFAPASHRSGPAERSKAALEASELRFKATFEQAAVGIAIVSLSGRWLRVNRKLCAIVGFDQDELLQKTFADITHPEDLHADLDNVQRVLSGEIATYTQEKRYIRKDGQSVWINLTVSLARNPKGQPEYFISVIEDIGARKAAEAAAASSTLRLAELAKVIERIAEIHDVQNLMEVVRGAVRQLTGADGVTLVLREGDQCYYADEDAIGPLWKGQRFAMAACISGWVMLHNEQAIVEDIFADSRLPHAAYRPTFVKSLAMVPVGRGHAVAAIGCYWARRHRADTEELALQQALADAMSVGLRNIQLYQGLRDASRKAEESAAAARQQSTALREKEKLMRLFIEHAPASLAMFDRDMRYLAVSRRWIDDYGLGGDRVIGHSHYDIFPEIPDAWRDIHQRALAGQVIRSDEDCFVRQDGARQWLRWEVRPWFDADDCIGGIAIFSEDISRIKEVQDEVLRLNADLERKVAERTAELSAANAELESFAYAVSHDLRAPLRAMSGFSQALVEDYADRLDGEALVYLHQIDLASANMGKLIDGILTLSRSTRGEVQRDMIDISAIAERILAELARQDRHRQVAVRVEPKLCLNGDQRMIEAVMENLLSNAWKYTSRQQQAEITVTTAQIDDQPGICVHDTGAGFDPAYIDRLFRPFQRLHRQDEFPGIGIGLATAHRIIHRHGGRLQAQGRPGQGASFTFSLPPAPSEEPS